VETANAPVRLGSRVAIRWRYFVSHPQRLEISVLGTRIRAEGVIGIIGAVMLVGLILAMYIGN
jgi:tetrahydromethanopterin S-methyltransferase subunit F